MTAQPNAAAGRPRQINRVRQLCGMVLVMEAIVIALAIVPAKALEHVNGAVAGGVGGGLAILAILLSAVVGRPRMGWALTAGTILQVLVIASGVWVHAMYVLGVVFGALWLTGIWLARRIERETRERQATHQPPPT
ncbi:MAG TPA: DUF4233 domain-containing protein [Streptosporangiaceae bacterium]|nr:DUF4233 domain-containing protein [Streptosporangiaceae bacterium]